MSDAADSLAHALAALAAQVPELADLADAIRDDEIVLDDEHLALLSCLSPEAAELVEQALSGPVQDLLGEMSADVSAQIGDAEILEAALIPRPSGQVRIDEGLIMSLTNCAAFAARLIGDPDDRNAVRGLLVAGFANVLPRLDPGVVVRDDVEEVARSVAVIAAASDLAQHLMVCAELFMEHLGSETLDIGAFSDDVDGHFIELVRWFPDVVDHFDALLASEVERALTLL